MGAMHEWGARLCALSDEDLLSALNHRVIGDGWDTYGREVCEMEFRRRGIKLRDVAGPRSQYPVYEITTPEAREGSDAP